MKIIRWSSCPGVGDPSELGPGGGGGGGERGPANGVSVSSPPMTVFLNEEEGGESREELLSFFLCIPCPLKRNADVVNLASNLASVFGSLRACWLPVPLDKPDSVPAEDEAGEVDREEVLFFFLPLPRRMPERNTESFFDNFGDDLSL